MKRKISCLLLSGLLVVFSAVAVFSAEETKKEEKKEPKYLGVKLCKSCHKEQYEIMSKAKMFKTLELLKSEKAKKVNPKADTDPKCLKCHVTGLGKEGGYDPKAKEKDNERLAFVGCEACHGPGGDYMKLMAGAVPIGSGKFDLKAAKEAGLVIPDEKVCVKCHNKESPFFEKFVYKERVKVIDHHYVEKEKGEGKQPR